MSGRRLLSASADRLQFASFCDSRRGRHTRRRNHVAGQAARGSHPFGRTVRGLAAAERGTLRRGKRFTRHPTQHSNHIHNSKTKSNQKHFINVYPATGIYMLHCIMRPRLCGTTSSVDALVTLSLVHSSFVCPWWIWAFNQDFHIDEQCALQYKAFEHCIDKYR